MIDEIGAIHLIRSLFPCAPDQQAFACDVEVLDFGLQKIALSIDTFSAEDHFRQDNPSRLGGLVAVAAISDLLAAGIEPRFYSHSITAGPDWDSNYLEGFCRGAAKVLEKAGMQLCGGDFGSAPDWSYTVAVFGELSGTLLNRNTAKAGDLICMSGRTGAGNLEAFLEQKDSRLFPRLGFPLRLQESRLIRKYATACMDTSDGLLNSVFTLSRESKCGFILDNLNIMPAAKLMARLVNEDPRLLAFCECGEYELLFTLPKDSVEAFFKEARERGQKYCILGCISDDPDQALYRGLDLSTFSLHGRDFREAGEYVRAVSSWWKALSGGI